MTCHKEPGGSIHTHRTIQQRRESVESQVEGGRQEEPRRQSQHNSKVPCVNMRPGCEHSEDVTQA